MLDGSDFKLSPARQQAIDDYFNFPVWVFLFADGEWDGERMVYRVTRKFCREAGMTPGEIVRAAKRGMIVLVP